MSLPLVSVLLPVFNGSTYLNDTLHSICRQSYQNFEIIIVDDLSSDNSLEIIDRFLSKAKIKIVKNTVNIGVCENLKKCIHHSNGEYLAMIGQDDIWHEDHLSCMVNVLNKNKTLAAVFSGIAYINNNNEHISESIFNHEIISDTVSEKLFTKLCAGNFLCAPSSMFRKSFYKEEFWGVNNERLQDYELWLNLLTLGMFGYTNLVTCSYRVHKNNLSAGNKMRLQSEYELVHVLSRVFNSANFQKFCSLMDDYKFTEFIKDLNFSFFQLSEYCSHVDFIHSAFLENVSLNLKKNPNYINMLRGLLMYKMGLYRKGFSLLKNTHNKNFGMNQFLPFLIPTSNRSQLYHDLIEFGVFNDGDGVDLTKRNAPYFFHCKSNDVSNLMKYEQFSAAYSAGKVIVEYDENAGLDINNTNCINFKSNHQICHFDIDQIFMIFEEKYRSFR